jgi:hypothetical protein
MKKNFKLMLVALFTLLGFNGVQAASLVGTTQYLDNGFKYKIKSVYKTPGGAKVNTVSVSQNVYASQGAAAMVIGPTVDIYVKGEDSDGVSIDKVCTFNIVEIEDNAFKDVTKATTVQIGSNIRSIGANAFDGCTNVTNITFDNNSNEMTIADEAFKGTKVTELDLTTLTGTLVAVNKWWNAAAFTPGTTVNNYLQTIKFPAKVLNVVPDAFAGFKKLKNAEFKAQSAPYVTLSLGTGAFQETPIETLDLTEARINILYPLFEYNNVTLKKVIMSKYVTILDNMALADCIQLGEVDFSQSTKLAAIGDGALSNTVVPEYDFSKCYETSNTPSLHYTSWLDFSGTDNPFVNGTTTTNKNLTTVKLPKHPSLNCPVTTIGTTFADCEVLTTIESLDVSMVTTVPDGAFANDKSLPSLEFPLALTTVAGSPFVGCEKLATLTFNNQSAAALTIGDGAANIYGATLAALTTVNINTQKGVSTKKTANVTIASGALAGCTGITTLNVAVGGKFAGTIKTFALNADADAAVTFGDITGAASVETIAGPIGKNTTALIIGEFNPSADFGGAIVDGNISSATVGAVEQKSVLTAIGQAVKITFTGNVNKDLDQSPANLNLTTLDFGAVKMAAGRVGATVFDESVTPNLKDVTWKPADGDAKAAFDKNAFNTSATPLGAGAYVTFHTTTAVGDGIYHLDEANLIAVIFDATAAIIDPTTIDVYNAVATGFFYGKLQAPVGKNIVINKTNDDGDQVDVYSAFVDELDQKIYMDRLATSNGLYVVAPGQVVVVRVKNPTVTTAHASVDGAFTAKVAIVEDDVLDPTMRYTATATILNDLKMTDKIFSSDYIGTNYVGKTLYAMANPAIVGALQFDPVAKTSYLPKGAVFVETDEAAPSRLDVIWLDDAEDATAIINTIESRDSKANGKIYNLQGIEVDGSYKGIVIVNGKKISQK